MNNEIGVKLGSNLLLEEAQQVETIEDTPSTGTFNAVLTGNTLAITGEFSDLTSDLKITGDEDSEGNPASAISIHLGSPGENGDIVRNLILTDNGNGFIGNFELNESELQAAVNDELYINLYTEDNPTGELRGQIELDPQGQIELDPRSVQDPDIGGIDLRNLTSDQSIEVEFKITREADFDNIADFYIADDNGNAIDPVTGDTIAPGDEDYLETALSTRRGLDLSTDDDQEVMLTRELTGGYNYAPMIVVQGTFEELGDDDSSNNPQVYFPYAAANADGAEYIKGMGEMKFGFEDLDASERQVAGEPDFNDITFEVFQSGEI